MPPYVFGTRSTAHNAHEEISHIVYDIYMFKFEVLNIKGYFMFVNSDKIGTFE